MITLGLMLPALMAFPQQDRNVMIYNVTSTDCGPCSCMDSIYKNSVLQSYPNTIVVAFHAIGSYFNEWQGSDVVHEFRADYEPSGFPDGLGYDVFYLDITDTVGARYDQVKKTPVAVEIDSKTWDPVTREVNLTVTMRNDGPELSGEYWYNVIVTEDNIKHVHRTMDSCSTPDVPDLPFRLEYFNNWVTRSMIFHSQGDSLTGPSWPLDKAFTNSTTFEIDTAWIPENCNLVINVYKKADSLYKSLVMQVIKESVTGSSSVSGTKSASDGIIRIYPNPASDITNLHISLSSGAPCSLNIYDMRGNLVKEVLQGYVRPGMYNIEISTRDLPAGTYLIVMKTDKVKTQQKIVVL